MVVNYRGRVPFIIILFSFLATQTAHTREPIPTHDSSKNAFQRKEVLSERYASVFRNVDFCGSFSMNIPQISPIVGKSHPNEKVEQLLSG